MKKINAFCGSQLRIELRGRTNEGVPKNSKKFPSGQVDYRTQTHTHTHTHTLLSVFFQESLIRRRLGIVCLSLGFVLNR